MNQPVPHVFHPHHWHIHETLVAPPNHDVVRNPDIPIIYAFRIAAAVYLSATLAAICLLSAGVISPAVVGGRFILCAGIGVVSSALAFLGGIIYGLPNALGGSIWSVKLAWSHFVVLNVAVLMPLGYLVFDRTVAELAAGEILAAVLILHAGAIVAFIANMIETIIHFAMPDTGSRS